MSETRLARDAISPLAAMAMSTSRAKLGSAAVNVFTRNAALTAVTFATLDELSHGRMILGLAPGSPSILEKQGIEFDKPLKRIKEYVEVIRRLVRGEKVTYTGEFVTVREASLDFTPPRKEIPIYLAVSGPNALRMAGKIADGVILDAFTSVDYAKRALRLVKEGADASGRHTPDIDVGAFNMMSVDQDSATAKSALKPLIANYFVTFPSIAKESGLDDELFNQIRSTYFNKGQVEAAHLISDSIVDQLTVSGNPDECVSKLRSYLDAGVKIPIIVPTGASTYEVAMTTSLRV